MARLFERFTKKVRRSFSPALVITLVFAALVLLGAGILCLPFASRSGESCDFLTALFTACSATCVTGLSLVDTYTQWSGFGQAVLLVLIQVGGLGFMTVFSMFLLLLKEKIGLKKRMLLQQTYGLNDIEGVVELLRRVLKTTALIEGVCAVVLTLRFMREYAFFRSLWMGVFHSISAFCNAGFDILGFLEPGCSLIPFSNDPVVLGTVMLLIQAGGIGFFVWDDLWENRRHLSGLCVYTKLVLLIDAVLVFGGALLFGALEWSNPATLGSMGTGGRLLGALFQSVTTRTAGFSGIPQGAMTPGSQALSCFFMLTGGASGSTAGGMKIVTVGVLLLSALSYCRGKTRITVMRRTVNPADISLAAAIVVTMTTLTFLGAVILTVFDKVDFLRALYETSSALGTVGLTADVTPTLCIGSKLMIIVFMFFGRVGITTISTGLLFGDRAEEHFRYAETKMLIG